MDNGCQGIISDPRERKVFEALADPEWDFRTVSGLSKATGLSEAEIRATLDKYPLLIRKSLVPARNGHELFTLHSRPVKLQERLAELRMFISKTVP